MLWDYELAISCGLAAIAVLHVMDLRRRGRRLRDLQRIGKRPVDDNKDRMVTQNSTIGDARDPADEVRLRTSDRLILLLLVLALFWFAWRIWMEW